MTDSQIRLLGPDDADASVAMSAEAFGIGRGNTAAFTQGPGLWRWGLFDDGRLVAKANDRAYDSFFGGRAVPTAGVAGVAVAPEQRGRGLARQVMTHLLRAARERGAVVSTLFRTAPALYRTLGYEQICELQHCELPVSALGGARVPRHLTLRRATAADMPAVRALYASIAAQQNGFLTRTGPCFAATDEDVLAGFDGVTLACEPSGEVVGYCSWVRGPGVGATAALEASDLLAVTADGFRALVAALGSFASVTGLIRFRSSGIDPLPWFVPGPGWTVRDVQPYLLRVIDLATAVAARGWPDGAVGSVQISVRDPVCPWNTGHHKVVVGHGEGHVEAGSGGGVVLSPAGLAVLYGGAVPAAVLRRAGLLAGGTPDDDAVLDAATAGPRPGVLDFF